MMWLWGGLVLVALAWVIARARQKPAAKPPAPSVRSKGTDLSSVPSVILEEDDLEITIVTASPPTPAPPPMSSGGKAAPIAEGTAGDKSNVNVIYEDEADVEEVTSPHARILVSASGESDQGQRRPRNEDSFLVLPERSLFAVADGMGGYEGGQVASSLAVDVLREAFEKSVFEGKTVSETPVPRRGKEMACAIQMANQAIMKSAQSDRALAQMGTTIVAARFSPNKQRVYIGHVGDSRCYRLRTGKLRQLTTDHTMHELGMRGPGSHQLFQAVGINPTFTVDLIVDKPRPDDLYLLCSDGLPKMVTDEQIQSALLGEPDLEAAVYTLIELANDQGGKDNITVILVQVLERPTSEVIQEVDAGWS